MTKDKGAVETYTTDLPGVFLARSQGNPSDLYIVRNVSAESMGFETCQCRAFEFNWRCKHIDAALARIGVLKD